MKNSEISTISISRNKEIQANVETAMIRLDEWNHLVGNLVMIKYYTEDGNIDALFAVGVKEGIGRDCYSIISTAELYVVNDVLYEDPVSVESLVDYQRFLCKHDGEWKILKLGENKYRTYIDIPKDPYIFRNLADGFQYFYVDGELKREDAFITAPEIERILKELEEALDPPKISQLEIIGGTLYPAGSTVSGLQFNLSVSNYKDEDITDQFTIKLYKNDGLDEVTIEKIDNNRYRLYEDISVTTTYSLKAIGEDITLEDSFTIKLVGYTFHGTMSEYNPAMISSLGQRLWDGIEELEFSNINLVNEITVFAIPSDLISQEFTSIKDTHGLNYIDDYVKTVYESNGKNYTVYYKKDQVTINNFKQTFGYE